MYPNRASCQLQVDAFCAQDVVSEMTVLNGWALIAMSMPAWLASDFHCCTIWSSDLMPLAYSSLRCNAWPAGTPGPHWPAPLPGLVQVITPFCWVQPWLVSRLLALLMLNAYGPAPCSRLDTYWLPGTVGMGPVVGTA